MPDSIIVKFVNSEYVSHQPSTSSFYSSTPPFHHTQSHHTSLLPTPLHPSSSPPLSPSAVTGSYSEFPRVRRVGVGGGGRRGGGGDERHRRAIAVESRTKGKNVTRRKMRREILWSYDRACTFDTCCVCREV